MSDFLYVDPALSLDGDVAIVGPSISLIGSGVGKDIDAFSEIIRFNRAPVKGYEKDVGSKTSLRVLNSHVYRNMILGDEYPDLDYRFIPLLRSERLLMHGWVQDGDSQEIHSSCTQHFIQQKLVDGLMQLGGKQTMGATAIFLCVASNIVPTLYGFDFTEGRSHYWERRPSKSPWHVIKPELEMLKKFLESGQIKVHCS